MAENVGPSLSTGADLENRESWKELGSGAFSTVYSAFCSIHNEDVAVKEVHKKVSLSEVKKLITMLPHNHIIGIKGFDECQKLIIMELCPYSLAILREKLGDNFIPWPQSVNFMQHMMSGLEYLHLNGIVHRDLKPANIMVTKDFVCKIADLGLAKEEGSHTNSKSNSDIVCPSGTLIYISPERWENPGLKAEETDDIYSCGILMYKMITNENIFGAENRRHDDTVFADLKLWVATKQQRPPIENIHRGGERAPLIVETVIQACWSAEIKERKTSKYWADLLRKYIKKVIPSRVLEAAKEQLKQLLSQNASPSESSRTVQNQALIRGAPEGAENTGGVTGNDDVDNQAMAPLLQQLVSTEGDVEEQMRNLCVGEIDAMILDDSNGVAQHYHLELMTSYQLSFDQDGQQLVFHPDGDQPVHIPHSMVHSFRPGREGEGTLQLYFHSGKPLTLSVSSIERAVSGLEALSVPSSPERSEISSGKPLKTADFEPPTNYGAFQNNSGYSYDDAYSTPRKQPPPYSMFPQESLQLTPNKRRSSYPYSRSMSCLPNQTYFPSPNYPPHTASYPHSLNQQPQQPSSVQVYTHVANFNYGSTIRQNSPVQEPEGSINQCPPYRDTELTRSDATVTQNDMIKVQGHVARAYERVGRLLEMEDLELETIKFKYRENNDLEEASYRLIKAWVDKNGTLATKAWLARALYEARLYAAAQIL